MENSSSTYAASVEDPLKMALDTAAHRRVEDAIELKANEPDITSSLA